MQRVTEVVWNIPESFQFQGESIITYVSAKLHSYFYVDLPENRKYKFNFNNQNQLQIEDQWINELNRYGWKSRKRPPSSIYNHVLLFHARKEYVPEFDEDYRYEYSSPNIIWAYNGLDEISCDGKRYYVFDSPQRLEYMGCKYPDLKTFMNDKPHAFHYNPPKKQLELF